VDLEALAAVAAAVIAAIALRFSATAARAAKESAKEAAAIARVEKERRQEERERRHEELAPPPISEIKTYFDVNVLGRRILMGHLTLPRDYNIRIVQGSGASQLVKELGPPQTYAWRVEAGHPFRFEIEEGLRPEGDTRGHVDILFWPPEKDRYHPSPPRWRCRCSRPKYADDGSERGHWELLQVPLALPEPQDECKESAQEGRKN
jgi:hypothetical protein